MRGFLALQSFLMQLELISNSQLLHVPIPSSYKVFLQIWWGRKLVWWSKFLKTFSYKSSPLWGSSRMMRKKAPVSTSLSAQGKKQASSQLPIGSTKWIDPEVETCLGHESNPQFTETTTIAFPLGFVSSRPDMDHLGYASYLSGLA